MTLAASILTIRDFERFLRDAGFSRGAARSIAATGFHPSRVTEMNIHAGDSRDATPAEATTTTPTAGRGANATTGVHLREDRNGRLG